MLGLARIFHCDCRDTGSIVAASAQLVKDRWIPTLDGWRAVAVMMVVVAHELVSKPDINPSIDSFALRLGPLGVQIFFAISGYLICTLLLLESDKRPISLRAFYTRRVFRILPPAFTYLTVVGLLSAAGVIAVRGIDIASCILLFANYITNGWYVAHFWSLSVEEHFYLLWPAILAFAGWRRHRISLSPASLPWGVGVCTPAPHCILENKPRGCAQTWFWMHSSHPACWRSCCIITRRLKSESSDCQSADYDRLNSAAGRCDGSRGESSAEEIAASGAVAADRSVYRTSASNVDWPDSGSSCDALDWPDLLLAVSMATDVCGTVAVVEHPAVSACGVGGNRGGQLLFHRASNDGVRAIVVAAESF